MKRTFILGFCSLLFLASCKNNGNTASTESANSETASAGMETSSSDKIGTFSVDGKEYKGKIEVQHFGAKGKENFSVLCQQDGSNSAFALLQTTFVTESDARGSGEIKIYDGSILPMTDPKPGIATVSLSGFGESFGDKEFSGTGKSTGTINVDGNTISIKDLKIFNREGASKTINASLPF